MSPEMEDFPRSIRSNFIFPNSLPFPHIYTGFKYLES